MDTFSVESASEVNGEKRVQPIVAKNSVKGSGRADIIEKKDFPILEYDDFPDSITQVKKDIYPENKKVKRCVITYFQDVIAKLEAGYKIFQTFKLRIEGARPKVYEMQTGGGETTIYVLLCPLGAPQAARMLEIMSALGVEKFIICGGAGTLDNDVTTEKILIPTSAVRDEGTSYHYLPPSREVSINETVRKRMTAALTELGENFIEIKTWTTDASFRETPDKVALRKAEGCVTVEMECSAYYSVAQYKKLMCGQLLYAGDVVKKEGWEYRNWHDRNDMREHLFDLAVQCVLKL
jgi:uridine phosphorylase